jgi:hypothetical protein
MIQIKIVNVDMFYDYNVQFKLDVKWMYLDRYETKLNLSGNVFL